MQEYTIGDLVRWNFETANNIYEGVGLIIDTGDFTQTMVNHMGENAFSSTKDSLLVRWGWVNRIEKHLQVQIVKDKPLDGFEPTRDTWVRKDLCKVLSQVDPSYLDHEHRRLPDSDRRQPDTAEG